MQLMDAFSFFRRLTVTALMVCVLGCGTVPPAALPISPSNLTAYATATLSVNPTPTVVATEIPIPTPTPFTYVIVKGDTLSTIAERFGIRLDDLQLANPGVVAESLSVGQMLKIPAKSASSSALPAATPAPADLGPSSCYPSGTGLYCLVPVHNPYPEALENVKLQMTLLDAAGQSVASQEAFLPLNILPPGSILPAFAFFPAFSADAWPAAQLVTSIRLLPGDARYLAAAVRSTLVSVAWDGRSARAQGQVSLSAESNPASALWLAAVAYDAYDQIVGFRRWEWQGNLAPGGSQPFDFAVYSLGQAIERVDIVVEARP
jgi:LysM repeat protein